MSQIDSSNIEAYVAPAVENGERTVKDLLFGLVGRYGERAIESRFAERTPPAPAATTNRDTAEAEMRGFRGALADPNTVKYAVMGLGALAVVALIVYAKD